MSKFEIKTSVNDWRESYPCFYLSITLLSFGWEVGLARESVWTHRRIEKRLLIMGIRTLDVDVHVSDIEKKSIIISIPAK